MKQVISIPILAMLFGVLACVPVSASALSIADLQTQLAQLEAQIATLTSQAVAPPATVSTSVSSSANATASSCTVPDRNLSYGVQGSDVEDVQNFLIGQGLLNAQATGYFGPATLAAVKQWQGSQGISSTGFLGSQSRARLQILCGGTTGGSSGGTGGSSSGGGGSVTSPVACTTDYTPACGQPQGCLPCNVPAGYACPMICQLSPATTYSNTCLLSKAGATFLHTGVCTGNESPISVYPTPTPTPKPTPTDPSQDPTCKAWSDGCDSCTRTSSTSPAMCVYPPCAPLLDIAGMSHTYHCTAYFGGASTNSKAPSISSFSGPSTLALNQSGTWNIFASDPNNEQLTYSIIWGDETMVPLNASMGSSGSVTQATSFTHAYASPGTYTVIISVSNTGGVVTTATATVVVQQGTSACTGGSSPVCGRPSGCQPQCQPTPGYACPLIQSQLCQMYPATTYANTCLLNQANAAFLHTGACTGTESYY